MGRGHSSLRRDQPRPPNQETIALFDRQAGARAEDERCRSTRHSPVNKVGSGRVGSAPGHDDAVDTKAVQSYTSAGAKVAELVDAQDSGSCGRKAVGVRLPPFATHPTGGQAAIPLEDKPRTTA